MPPAFRVESSATGDSAGKRGLRGPQTMRTPPGQPRPLRCAMPAGVWKEFGRRRRSPPRLNVFRSRAEFFPHIATLGPFVVRTRQVQFLFLESAVSVRTNVFD